MIRIVLFGLIVICLAALVGTGVGALINRIQKALASLLQPTYTYVRFRNGELTLRREGFLGEKEVVFLPEQGLLALPAPEAAAISSHLDWFTKEGHKVPTGSTEHQAIQEALQFARSTGRLEIEEGLR